MLQRHRYLLSFVASTALLGGVLSLVRASSAAVIDHVRGRIILDVEMRGEAWYVDPATDERTYLGRPENAWRIMRDFGLGISDADLSGIVPAPIDPSSIGNVDAQRAYAQAVGAGATRVDRALAKRLAGRIVLQTEGRGEAWYVDPVDLRRYYLGRPEDAFAVMRARALGATHADVLRIPESGVSARSVRHEVPFIAQAPLGDWSDSRQADACEEASVMMAMAWVDGERIDAYKAEGIIHDISDFERAHWGYYEDTGVADTAERILKGWFKHENYEVKTGIGVDDIYRALADGHLVIAAVDGTILAHPGFRRPAPSRHMVLVVGYDAEEGVFLVHEPGTSRGAYWRYPRQIMSEALRDYPSGIHLPVTARDTAIIVVRK